MREFNFNDNVELDNLNSNPDLDLFSNNIFLQEIMEFIQPLNCEFFSENSFCKLINENFQKDLLFMSINMQSLPAKFNHLTSFVDHLNLSNIQFNILAFQEYSVPFLFFPKKLTFLADMSAKGGGAKPFIAKKM